MASNEGLRLALGALAADRHDENAWRVLFRAMWPYMVTVCARLLGGDTVAAQEAAQDALTRLARYAPFGNLQDPDAFRAYSRTVCRRVVHARYRAQGAAVFVPLGEGTEPLLSDKLDPEQEVSASTLLETILAELSPDDQRILRMTVAGYSLSDIAESLGIMYPAAAVRVHRLRQRLRKWLQ